SPVLSGRGGVTGVTELTGTIVFTSRAAVNSGRGASSFCSGCAVTAGLLPDGVVAVTVCTGIVRKFPSARRGSDAATGFASEDCSSFLAFSLACSIVIQVSDVVALHSNSVLVPAQPESNNVPSRGIKKEICFIVPHLSHRSSQNHSSNP